MIIFLLCDILRKMELAEMLLIVPMESCYHVLKDNVSNYNSSGCNPGVIEGVEVYKNNSAYEYEK